jgi:hypothetical protein
MVAELFVCGVLARRHICPSFRVCVLECLVVSSLTQVSHGWTYVRMDGHRVSDLLKTSRTAISVKSSCPFSTYAKWTGLWNCVSAVKMYAGTPTTTHCPYFCHSFHHFLLLADLLGWPHIVSQYSCHALQYALIVHCITTWVSYFSFVCVQQKYPHENAIKQTSKYSH